MISVHYLRYSDVRYIFTFNFLRFIAMRVMYVSVMMFPVCYQLTYYEEIIYISLISLIYDCKFFVFRIDFFSTFYKLKSSFAYICVVVAGN